ncbi:SusC/RagA family TonB-linked outer membrane protein [Thermoflavifilum thermophilum]|nr:SusC/RagA family TonB-linked outer membrane protein [Thermoflavifilum thermophilum]
MKKLLTTLLALTSGWLIFTQEAKAQNIQERIIIRGKVTDASSHMPVIGASVAELDKDNRIINGTTTDIDGNFALKVNDPVNNRISISYIGYKTLVQPIRNQREMNIHLESSSRTLSEVQITAGRTVDNGTGLMIPERNSTFATTTIDAQQLENLSFPSIDMALEGKVAGVDIGATTGDPGAGMSIRIRGTTTINGSDNPLIILDGMPYNIDIPSDFNFGTADEQGYAQLLNIAPSDIKDITILKDAASTALWGSRAANGVIVINTKRGTIGRPSVGYSFKGSISWQPRGIPLLNGYQYTTLIMEEVANAGGAPLDIRNNKEFAYDPTDPYWYYNYSRNTDWIGAITQTGYSQEHDISMMGGGEKARYYASVGYLTQTGTTVGTGLNRITSTINLDYNVSDRIHFRSDISYTHIITNGNYVPNSSYQVRSVAYRKMPNMSIYEYDIYGNQTPNYFSPASNIQGSYYQTYNPVALAKTALNRQVGERVTPRFHIQYDIFPSYLIGTFDVQFDINNSKVNTFLPQIATGRPITEPVVNQAGLSDGDVFDVYTKTNLIFNHNLPDENHQLQALLSIQTDDNKSIAFNEITSNTASSSLQDPASPSNITTSAQTLSSTKAETRSIGIVLQGQYDLMDRYIINAGIRMDGSSRFGPAHRYGFFPSISGRWRISGEPFMKQFAFINDMSLRLSYGHSGSTPPDKPIWNYFNTYSPFSYSYMGMSGVYPSNVELSDLRWQTLIGSNLGYNIWMFHNRIRFDMELYRNRIKDMFYDNIQIPAYTGYNTIPSNVGTMDNQGWEIMLNTIPYRSKNWELGFDFNISKNANIIRSISPYFPRTNIPSITQNGVYKTYLQINNPFGSFYGFRYLGVYKDKESTIARDASGKEIIGPDGNPVYMRFGYPNVNYVFQPGDAMYEDVNHDGVIDDKDIVYLGNGLPKISGGFGINITYKEHLKLITFFVSRLGYQLVNYADMVTSNMYGFDNQSTVVLKRWRNPGDITDIPRALYRSGYNWLGSSRYVQDASFLRLQAVTIRYNFSNDLLNRLKIRAAAFYITGENLYTWTKYKGQNPDQSIIGNNNPFAYPVDNALTPIPIDVVIGLNVSF